MNMLQMLPLLNKVINNKDQLIKELLTTFSNELPDFSPEQKKIIIEAAVRAFEKTFEGIK